MDNVLPSNVVDCAPVVSNRRL